jgi:influenza virus NS1A-binding protein
MVAVWGGKIYVVGGFSERSYSITAIEVYDPAADTWTTIGQMPFARAGGAACVVGNKLYCIGGKAYDPVAMGDVAVKSIDIYNLSTNKWSKGPSMQWSRAEFQILAANGKIYIFGGSGGEQDSIALGDREVLLSTEAFDTLSNSCEGVISLQTPRCRFAAAAIGSTVYLIGGMSDDVDKVLLDVEVLDISTLQSAATPPLAKPRCSAQAVALNGRIYCIGGLEGSKPESATKSVIVFYP